MAHTDEQRADFGHRLRALRGDRPLREIVSVLLREHDMETSTAQLSAWERGEYAPRYRSQVEVLEEAFNAGGQLLDALGYYEQPRRPFDVATIDRAFDEEDPAEVEWAVAWFAALTPDLQRDVQRYVTLQIDIALKTVRPRWVRDMADTLIRLAGDEDTLTLTREEIASGTRDPAAQIQNAVAAEKAKKPPRKQRGATSRAAG